jgi:hypothetical protein
VTSPRGPTTRREWLKIGLFGFAAILGLSIILGFIGHSPPSVVVQGPDGAKVQEPTGFDWGLWALVLTGLGTTALAVVTGLLAFSTWQDVRASTELAAVARNEQVRRPELTLLPDADRTFSRVEAGLTPYMRLLVHNAADKRAANGARVMVPQYRSWRERIVTLGSPSLGWPSAPEAIPGGGALVIFSGISRAIDLGYLIKEEIGPADDQVVSSTDDHGADGPTMWCMRLALHTVNIGDRREYLVPGPCVVRLVVGADEAETREYDVTVNWKGDAADAQAAFDSVDIGIADATGPLREGG